MNILALLLLLTLSSCCSKPKPRNAPLGKIEAATCILGSRKLIDLMKPQKITIELEYILERNCEGGVKSAVEHKQRDLSKAGIDDEHESKPERYWDYYACYLGTERVYKYFFREVTPNDHSRVRRYMATEINKNYEGESWNDNYLRVREEVCKDAMVELNKFANEKE